MSGHVNEWLFSTLSRWHDHCLSLLQQQPWFITPDSAPHSSRRWAFAHPGAAWRDPHPQACPGAMPSVSPLSLPDKTSALAKNTPALLGLRSLCLLSEMRLTNFSLLSRPGIGDEFFFSDSYNWKWFLPVSPRHLFGLEGRRLDFPHHSFWHVVLCTAEALWGLKLIFIHFHTLTCALHSVLQITGNLCLLNEYPIYTFPYRLNLEP